MFAASTLWWEQTWEGHDEGHHDAEGWWGGILGQSAPAALLVPRVTWRNILWKIWVLQSKWQCKMYVSIQGFHRALKSITKCTPQIQSWAWWNFRVFHIFCKTYFCKVVLGFLPDRNQTSAERFSGEWISITIKKSWTFDSPSQRSAKTLERGWATFNKMPITPEWNEISPPNSEH